MTALIRTCRKALVVVAALATAACGRGDPGTLPAEDIALNNRGVGLMGYFDYPGARAAFEELVARQPEWLDARVNLAIATLNRQEDGDESRALEVLDAVLAEAPGHVRAHYVSGLLRLYVGDTAESAGHFRQVLDADPDDAYAAYFLGQNLLQEGRLEETLSYYKQAMRLDPYLRSAYYGAALVLRRLDRRDEARKMIEAYESLADNPRARLAEFKYTRMGPRGEALAVGRSEARRASPPEGRLFEPAAFLGDAGSVDAPAGMTAADADGDGNLELLVHTPSSVSMLSRGGTGWAPVKGLPFAGTTAVTATAWGDFDNDGLVDLYLCRAGPNQLWRQVSPGAWEDATAASGTGGGDRDCADAAMIDADHDGDLDLFVVNAGAPDELFSNDRTGAFRPLGASQGIAGGAEAGRQFLAADLDTDRDLDLIVVNREPPHRGYVNDRLWRYREAEGLAEFAAADVAAAVAGDADADGRGELYALGSDGGLRVWRRGSENWTVASLDAPPSPWADTLGLQDFDGDGTPDLLLSGDGRIRVVSAADGGVLAEEGTDSGLASPVMPLNLDAALGPSLVALEHSGRLVEWAPGPGRHPFFALTFSGKEERAESMRSNRSGIGTQIGVRVGDRWGMAALLDRHSSPGQSLQPLSMGLSGAARADFVAINWSDGVFQTELGLEAGGPHFVPETQRQLSSCPVLFVWDGEQWRFTSDVLGVAGLGFLAEPGRYGEPRPWEFFLLPDGLARPRDGRYSIKITEPMEENAYLDKLRMHVFDLPPGWQVIPDERMQTGEPAVTGEPLFYRRAIAPASVRDAAGRDHTAALAAADHVAADPGSLDMRFLGRLADPLVLTVEFGQVVNPPGSRPVLAADGWVEYPYSQTVFAAWQAGARYEPPSLEARDRSGEWHTVHAGFGYPAGMPRRMALPLDALPPDTVALRLTSNLEIYWDRIEVVHAEPAPSELRHRVVHPERTRLAKTGFPARLERPQRRPDYDYGVRKAFWDTRYLPGFYTALGPVDPLLADADDAFVIMGPGEEVQAEFPAPQDPPAGWRRQLVLEVHGYAKDMDLYTEHGDAVGPLPRRHARDPEAVARRDALDARYQTRYQAGR